MTLTYELNDLNSFVAWSGAKDTMEILRKYNKVQEAFNLISELYPNGCSKTELNDFLWFHADYIFTTLGISVDEE